MFSDGLLDVCESLIAGCSRGSDQTTLFQTSLPYSSAPALGINLLVDVKDDCCTRPDNGLEILKCSYVTEESARDRANPSHCCCHTHRPPEEDHQPPPKKTSSCCSFHTTGQGSFTQPGLMTF